MLANGCLAAVFPGDIHDLVSAALEDVLQVTCGAMELLRSDNQIHVRQAVDQFLPPALRHAAHEAEDDVGAMPAGFGDQVFHLTQGLLFGQVPDAAGIEQDHIGGGLRRSEGIAFGYKLSGDCFAVALVHLAAISFDINAGHCWSEGPCSVAPQQ